MTDVHHEKTDVASLAPVAHDAADEVDDEQRTSEERVDRLAAGAAQLEGNRAATFPERTDLLLIIAGVLTTLGLTLIVIAWRGASGSIHVEEQMPYLISGGILGATLAIIGGLCVFTHWLTVGIREARAREQRAEQRHDELLAALGNLEEVTGNGRAPRGTRGRPLRSSSRGS